MVTASQALKTVVMINCGATEDIQRACDLSDNVRVIVIDSHRPLWHGYKSGDTSVLVVVDSDDPVPDSAVPEPLSDSGTRC